MVHYPRIRVAFRYLGTNFSPQYFSLVFPFLSDLTEVTSEREAELVIFSVYHDIPGLGPSQEDIAAGRFQVMPVITRLPGKIYLFYSGENVLPNMELCDYAITHAYYDHPNHLRLPYWVVALRCYGLTGFNLAKTKNITIPPLGDRRVCNFLYSHQVSFREKYATELMQFCEVVAPGVSLRNTSETVPPGVRAKVDFLAGFNFTIAFENSKDDGYTTEKLLEPLMAGSIPIYWGNDRVGEDFDARCFINVEDFSSVADLAAYLRVLLSDESAYKQIAGAPRFPNDEPPEVAKLEYSQRFVGEILDRIALIR